MARGPVKGMMKKKKVSPFPVPKKKNGKIADIAAQLFGGR